MLGLVFAFIIFVIITAYAVNLRICVEMFTGNSETQNLVCMSIDDYLTRQVADLSFLLGTHREFSNKFYSKPMLTSSTEK